MEGSTSGRARAGGVLLPHMLLLVALRIIAVVTRDRHAEKESWEVIR